MKKRPKVLLLIEKSRQYGRGLLRGIMKYACHHGPWIIEQTISSSTSCTINTGSTYDVVIGAIASSTYFNGLIDDVRIYSYPLSADNIVNIYNGLEPVEEEFICIVRPTGDLNGDCKVDFRDFAELARNWFR